MKKLRVFLILVAISFSIAAATNPPQPSGISIPGSGPKAANISDGSCPTPPGCEYEYPYVYRNGAYVYAGTYGQTFVCITNPFDCTWAYMYCPQYGDMRWFMCRYGQYCKITPYGCDSNPLVDYEGAKKAGVPAIIPLTPEQTAQIETKLAELKAQAE